MYIYVLQEKEVAGRILIMDVGSSFSWSLDHLLLLGQTDKGWVSFFLFQINISCSIYLSELFGE